MYTMHFMYTQIHSTQCTMYDCTFAYGYSLGFHQRTTFVWWTSNSHMWCMHQQIAVTRNKWGRLIVEIYLYIIYPSIIDRNESDQNIGIDWIFPGELWHFRIFYFDTLTCRARVLYMHILHTIKLLNIYIYSNYDFLDCILVIRPQ